MLKNLKLLRETQKLNKKEMAKKLEIEERTYLNYENGITEPNIKTQTKIADYFNVSLDYLCGRNFNKDIPNINLQDKETIKMFCTLTNEQKNFIKGEVKICYIQNQKK